MPYVPGSMLVIASRLCMRAQAEEKDGAGRALVAIEGDLCPLRHILYSDQLLIGRRNAFLHCRHKHFLVAFVLPVISRGDVNP